MFLPVALENGFIDELDLETVNYLEEVLVDTQKNLSPDHTIYIYTPADLVCITIHANHVQHMTYFESNLAIFYQ